LGKNCDHGKAYGSRPCARTGRSNIADARLSAARLDQIVGNFSI
jgi:hypothetical protein